MPTPNFTPSQKHQLLNLWNQVYPAQLAYESLDDLDAYLNGLENVHHELVTDEAGAITGWYFDFERDGAKWFAILLHDSIQGQGVGTRLLREAMQREPELNGWVVDHNNDHKLNGEPYLSPLNFYLRAGFEVRSENRLELEQISAVQIRWRKPC